MRLHWHFFIWTTGSIAGTHRIRLNPARRYVVTGGLTGRNGDDYSQVFISTVCRGTGPILCGVRDIGFSDLQRLRRLTLSSEILSGVSSIIVTLRSRGGWSRAEGVVWEL